MRKFILIFLMLTVILHVPSVAMATNITPKIQPEPDSAHITKQAVIGTQFMAVTANPLATKAAADILEKGGNAIDAAIAAQAVLNVVEPQSSGIGGGGFLLYYDAKTHDIHSFDGRETAPKNISATAFLDQQGKALPFFDALQGGMSVGVPGLLRMLDKAHQSYGQMEWKALFTPAIKVAENGFPLSERLYKVAESVPYLKDFPEASAMYLNKSGDVKAVGSLIYNPQLAQKFADIAAGGAQVFYQQESAQKIVGAITHASKNPGVMTVADIENYKAKKRKALCLPYRKYRVCGMGMPSSGGATIGLILGQLSHFPLDKMAPFSAKAMHLIVESMKLAYADRNAYMADSDFVAVPVDLLLSPKYLKARAKLMRKNSVIDKADPGILGDIAYAISENNEQPSTTHLSIVDKEGNAVSLTSSIEHAFGSAVMVDGFMLNNQLTDFAFTGNADGQTVANRIEPGKRPRSSMSPMIVLDEKGELMMVIGSPGGSRIIPYVAMRIIAVLDWGMELQDAVNMPNISNRNGVTEIEATSGDKAAYWKTSLEAIGHKVKMRSLNSGIHAIMKHDSILTGAADPRREGYAIGH